MDAPLRQPFRNSDRTLIGRAVNSRRRNAQGTANLRVADPAHDRRSDLNAEPEYVAQGGSNAARPAPSSTVEITVIQQQIVSLQLPQRVAGPTCRWSPARARISARQDRTRTSESERWSKIQADDRLPPLQPTLDRDIKGQKWKKVTLALAVTGALAALVGGFMLRTWIEGVPATIASAASSLEPVSQPAHTPPAIDSSEGATGPAASSPAETSPDEPSQEGIPVLSGTTKQEEAGIPPSLPAAPAVTSTQAANGPQPSAVPQSEGAPVVAAEPLTVHLRINARLAPEERQKIEALLAKAGYGSVVVHEMPFSISRSRVGFFQEADRASAEALISALQGTLDGLELRDYHEYRAAPEDHRLDLWIKS